MSNQAARSLDVSWKPPSDYWDALAVTGYQAKKAFMKLCGTRRYDAISLGPWLERFVTKIMRNCASVYFEEAFLLIW